MSIEIRRAAIADAAELVRLSAELGYPLTPEEMRRGLTAVLGNERHHVAVAADAARLLGWLHVERRDSLDGAERAEIRGLVVDSTARRRGLGRQLVEVAEKWALAQGASSLTVRSNVLRDLSHPFYESLGYARSKTQHVYRKPLAPGPAR